MRHLALESHTQPGSRGTQRRDDPKIRGARGSRDDGRAMNYASSGRAGFSLFDVSVAADPHPHPDPHRARRGGGGARAPRSRSQELCGTGCGPVRISPVFESRALEAGKRLQMTSTIRTARYEREASTLSPSPMRCVSETRARRGPGRWPCRPDTRGARSSMCAGGRREVHLAVQQSGSHSHVL